MTKLADNSFEIQVGIADYKVARNPGRLITLGLGSCVGVSFYDPVAEIGGLLHLMLPDSTLFNNVKKPAKFADLGIPMLVQELLKNGAKITRLQAKMVGGAQMFSGLDNSMNLSIGQRNIEKTRQVIEKLGLKINAEEVGGNNGRTMVLDVRDGSVLVRVSGKIQKVI